jgi:Fic family protein
MKQMRDNEMTWQDDRLSKRLTFSPDQTEALYTILSEIDTVKNTFRLTDRLAPQTINRLTQSVIVASTGASNRIEGNRLGDDEVEALYRNMHIRKFKTRDEQEVAGYLEMLELVLASYADMPVSGAFILQLHATCLNIPIRINGSVVLTNSARTGSRQKTKAAMLSV